MTGGWRGAAHYRNIFRRVNRRTWEVGEELWQITGGNLEFSALTDIKVAGSLEYKGLEIPDSRDLVLVYHTYETGDGKKVERPLATLVFSTSSPTYRGVLVSGTMECQSVLTMLSSRKYGAPFTIAAGTQAIQLAIRLIEDCGLRVNNPDPSAYTVKSDVTISKNEANYLTIVNRLLSLANYSSAWVDENGIVQITPYVEPNERDVSLVLSDDGNSIMYPELVRRNEWASTPNVVKVYYETDQECLIATATNVDPESPASLPYRGFEVTDDGMTVTDLEGETVEDRLANLEEIAKQALMDKTVNVEYVDGSCEFGEGMAPNKTIGIQYARAGIDWRGTVTNVNLELTKTLKADFSARRFVRAVLKIETTSEKLWG
jgi:hypothetical protein